MLTGSCLFVRELKIHPRFLQILFLALPKQSWPALLIGADCFGHHSLNSTPLPLLTSIIRRGMTGSPSLQQEGKTKTTTKIRFWILDCVCCVLASQSIKPSYGRCFLYVSGSGWFCLTVTLIKSLKDLYQFVSFKDSFLKCLSLERLCPSSTTSYAMLKQNSRHFNVY